MLSSQVLGVGRPLAIVVLIMLGMPDHGQADPADQNNIQDWLRANTPEIVSFKLGVQPGDGFDPADPSRRPNSAIDTSGVEGVTLSVKHHDVDIVDTFETSARLQSLDLAFAAQSCFVTGSVNVNAVVRRLTSTDTESRAIRVSSSIWGLVRKETVPKSPSLSKQAREYLDNNGAEAFLNNYGSRYVSAVYKGYELRLVFEGQLDQVTTREEAYKQASLAVDYLSSSVTAVGDTHDDFSQFAHKVHLHLLVFSVGGSKEIGLDDIGIDNWQDLADVRKKTTDYIKDALDNPVAIACTYSNVEDLDPKRLKGISRYFDSAQARDGDLVVALKALVEADAAATRCNVLQTYPISGDQKNKLTALEAVYVKHKKAIFSYGNALLTAPLPTKYVSTSPPAQLELTGQEIKAADLASTLIAGSSTMISVPKLSDNPVVQSIDHDFPTSVTVSWIGHNVANIGFGGEGSSFRRYPTPLRLRLTILVDGKIVAPAQEPSGLQSPIHYHEHTKISFPPVVETIYLPPGDGWHYLSLQQWTGLTGNAGNEDTETDNFDRNALVKNLGTHAAVPVTRLYYDDHPTDIVRWEGTNEILFDRTTNP
jgi:hypothetical protein